MIEDYIKELFENNCFPMNWTDERHDFIPEKSERLSALMNELDEIKENIDNVRAKQWNLEKLATYQKEGFSAE